MSFLEQYLTLGRGARWHLKLDRQGRPYFKGKRQTVRVIAGLICLVPLSASVLMALVLTGGEQVFYGVVSLLLSLLSVVLLGARQHLLFDKPLGVLSEQRSWWGLFARETQQIPLCEVRVVVAPIAALDQGCQLEMLEHRFTIGGAAETRQLAALLRDNFGVQALDRVAAWPDTRPLSDDGVGTPVALPADDLPADMRYKSLWDQPIVWKLALPLPLFALAGMGLSWVGS